MMLVLRRWRQEDAWDSKASQPSVQGELQGNERPPTTKTFIKKTKLGRGGLPSVPSPPPFLPSLLPFPSPIFLFCYVGLFSILQGNLFMKCPFLCLLVCTLGSFAWAIIIRNRLRSSRIAIYFHTVLEPGNPRSRLLAD